MKQFVLKLADRQMQLLKISGFPPGPDAYQAATYNEATATPYPALPDPLVMNDGTKVTTPAQWTKRRAEIKERLRADYRSAPAELRRRAENGEAA